MLGSIVSGIGNTIGNAVEDLAGEVGLDLDLDLDFQTLCGLGMGIATGNPMLISRGVLDVVDGEDDNLVQTFDQYSGLVSVASGDPSALLDAASGNQPTTGNAPLDFAINLFG